MTLQQRMANPTGAGHVWAAPERDIAHAFPGYVVRTMEAIKCRVIDAADDPEEQKDLIQMLGKYAESLKTFMAGCIGDRQLAELMAESGLLAPASDRHASEAIFAKWFLRVALSAYYQGVRDAHHPGEPRPELPDIPGDILAPLDNLGKESPADV